MGAVLHDVGHFVNDKSHHRHGEYLIRNGEVPGLRGWRRDMVAALVRYHNCKSEPQLEHASYAALDGPRRRQVAAAHVRCCASRKNWNPSTRSALRTWTVKSPDAGRFSMIRAADGTRLDLAGLERKADLFEKEFHLRAEFRRAQRKQR